MCIHVHVCLSLSLRDTNYELYFYFRNSGCLWFIVTPQGVGILAAASSNSRGKGEGGGGGRGGRGKDTVSSCLILHCFVVQQYCIFLSEKGAAIQPFVHPLTKTKDKARNVHFLTRIPRPTVFILYLYVAVHVHVVHHVE